MINQHLPLAAVLTALLISAAPVQANDDLLSCRAITNDSERLRCYDDVTARIADMVSNAPAARIGREQEFSDELEREITGNVKPTISYTQIIDIADDAYGKPIFTTEDGRRWKQSTSSRMARLDVGTQVHFESGALGSIFMVTESGRRIKVNAL